MKVSTPVRSFVCTSMARGRGTVDKELAAKLASEYKIETEMKDHDGPPPAIQEFLANGPFSVTDVQGTDEVILERKFGNETIKITFSVSDMNNMDAEETSFEDEEGADSSGTNEPVSTTTTAEEEGEEDEDSDGASFPVRCHITIQKDGAPQVLSLDTTTQDGIFIIDNMTLYATSQLALDDSAEADWKRRETYMGPPFSNLDEDLQILMERYLEERGVNTSLALFVPDYVDYKEAREYTDWLANLEKFIQV